MPLGLRDLVRERGACNLPSMTLDYACFVESMWTAVEMGFVMRERANFVAEGLLRGYDLGVDIRALRGARIFENYESATKSSSREAVCNAIKERVGTMKTIRLGVWSQLFKEQLDTVFGDYTIFPLGAVPKRDSPDECRPISEHKRSGLNAATNMAPFQHTLTAYKDVARFLKRGYAMAVADVRSTRACGRIFCSSTTSPRRMRRKRCTCTSTATSVLRPCRGRGISFSARSWCRWLGQQACSQCR